MEARRMEPGTVRCNTTSRLSAELQRIGTNGGVGGMLRSREGGGRGETRPTEAWAAGAYPLE